MARTGPSCAVALPLLLLIACQQPPKIAVGDAWARETAPGQSAAVYLTLANTGAGDDRLVAADSPAADSASLHSSSSSGGVARMRALPDGLDLAAGDRLELAPGGTHIMLTGLKRPLAAGRTVELRLRFARSGQQTLAVRVVPASTVDARSDHGMEM